MVDTHLSRIPGVATFLHVVRPAHPHNPGQGDLPGRCCPPRAVLGGEDAPDEEDLAGMAERVDHESLMLQSAVGFHRPLKPMRIPFMS